MKKEYIVELREEEADELMNEHWVGELIRCKDCKHRDENHRCYADNSMRGSYVGNNWFCADGERREAR